MSRVDYHATTIRKEDVDWLNAKLGDLASALLRIAEVAGLTGQDLVALGAALRLDSGPRPLSEHIARHRELLAQRIREVNATHGWRRP